MPVQKIKINYGKYGLIRFMGHLDTINLLFRALRRTGIPLTYTSGFNAHIKSSFSPALPLGFSSDAEYLELFLDNRVDTEKLKQDMQRQLPEGILLLGIERLPVVSKSLARRMRAVEYEVNLEGFVRDSSCLEKAKDEKKVIDMKMGGDFICNFVLAVEGGNSVSPRRVIGMLTGISEEDIPLLEFRRKKFYF